MTSPSAPPPADRALAQARLLALAAAVLWSLGGFFVKAPHFQGWPGPALAGWRAAFACLVLVPLVRRPRWDWRLVPMSALFAFMNYSYLTAMSLGTAANAIWLQLTAPVWVLLVGVTVLGERAIAKDWTQLGFVAAGVGVILWFESSGAAPEAVAWGLASGAAFAGVALSLRQLRDHDSAWLAALNHLVTLACLAPIMITQAPVPSGVQWALLAGLGIVQMGLPYVLFGRSLKNIPGHEATAIGMIEPLLVPAWVYLAWGERPAWWTFLGGGLILVGLAVRFLERSPRTAQPPVPVDGTTSDAAA